MFFSALTAKKGEITRPEITGTDAVITIQELGQYIRGNLNYSSLPEGRFDSFMGEGSGAGAIFGNSGGVMEAALRTASHLLSDKELLSPYWTASGTDPASMISLRS